MTQDEARLLKGSVHPEEVYHTTEDQAPAARSRQLRVAFAVLVAGLTATSSLAFVVAGVMRGPLAAMEAANTEAKDDAQGEQQLALFSGGQQHGLVRAAVGLEWMPPARLYHEEVPIETCVTQVCDCSWATGGPLGFCSTIGCPCKDRNCWDCCCKNLFPEEYSYAMGMRYYPPMPWWAWFLMGLVLLCLIALIGGSCFVIAQIGLGIDDEQEAAKK